MKLFNDDGTLITDAAPFAEGDSFEIVVSASNQDSGRTERSRLYSRQLESSAGSTEKCEECPGSKERPDKCR